MTIALLGGDELAEVAALLGANGLPTSDLTAASILLGVRDGSGLEGVVGLEPHGAEGLLRSLAVRHDRRGSGLGSALVLEVERLAAERGVSELYLLTTTAERFFGRRGYLRIDRESVPAAIRETAEFGSLCPSSAVVMRKPLGETA